MSDTLGQHLARLRHDRGLGLLRAALYTGVQPIMLHAIELGRVEPSPKELAMLAKSYGVAVETLEQLLEEQG